MLKRAGKKGGLTCCKDLPALRTAGGIFLRGTLIIPCIKFPKSSVCKLTLEKVTAAKDFGKWTRNTVINLKRLKFPY